MASQRLDKLASQFNYDLCISDSLYKFNNLVNGISNDYPKYLDLYKDFYRYNPVGEGGRQLSTPNLVKTPENEKKYQQLINIIKIGFSNEILNLIKEIVDECKYSSQQAVFIVTEIRDFLDRYTKEENYNSIYSETQIKKNILKGLNLSYISSYGNNVHGIKPKWTSNNGIHEVSDYLCDLFFNGYYQTSSKNKNEELNIRNYSIVYYYLNIFFKPLLILMGILENGAIKSSVYFIPENGTSSVPKLSFCFNFFNKGIFPDNFNIGFIRDYLICIKELLDYIILVSIDFKNIDNKYVDEDDKKEKEKEKRKEKINLLESRLKGVVEKINLLDQNLTTTIHEVGVLQDNPMLYKKGDKKGDKRGGKNICKSKKRKYIKQNKSRRRY
jgi:hypothetical protein